MKLNILKIKFLKFQYLRNKYGIIQFEFSIPTNISKVFFFPNKTFGKLYCVEHQS